MMKDHKMMQMKTGFVIWSIIGMLANAINLIVVHEWSFFSVTMTLVWIGGLLMFGLGALIQRGELIDDGPIRVQPPN